MSSLVTSAESAAPSAFSPSVLDRLARVGDGRGLPSLAERLADLDRWVRDDLRAFEQELATIPRGARAVHAAAHHLLDLRGKHLRPLCVALAARFGAGFTPVARGLAVAVELVHAATLLHDDVVDVAERRRGQPAASVVYGNAAAIFAGDWLLVAALRRIAASGVPGLLDRMLEIIDEMIVAESIQLERRGKIAGAREDYFDIVEGKTAALFRWAMVAGARASGPDHAVLERVLEVYGRHLGIAFQAVDDELDYSSDVTGKDPLADLREGKVTFPLVVAIERDAGLRDRLDALLADPSPPGDDLAAIAARVRATGALAATRTLAEEHVGRAIAVLDELPACAARDALVTVALASLERAS
ncbi:MAG: polyprenyl synthetase family protein [Deltaproteobacteria bacterium]|nr:polyprenyl synthetase family protein [Deltaproteobacteria bacterium]